MPTRLVALSAALLSLAGGTALAQPDARHVEFVDAEEVRAQPVGPIGETLTVTPRGPRHSLIRIREQFLIELRRSVENL